MKAASFFFVLSFGLSLVSHILPLYGSPELATDVFVSPCDFLVNPIETATPSPPSPPLPSVYPSPLINVPPTTPPRFPPNPSPPASPPTLSIWPPPMPPTLGTTPSAKSPPQFNPNPSPQIQQIYPPTTPFRPPNSNSPLQASSPAPPNPSPLKSPPQIPTNLSPAYPSPPSVSNSGCAMPSGAGLCGEIIPSFVFLPAISFVGGDVAQNLSGSASSSCAWQCLAMSNCTGFSKSISNGACFFKNSSATASSSSTYESWQQCNTSVYGPAATAKTVQTQGKSFRRRLLSAAALNVSYWSNPAIWPKRVVPGVGNGTGLNATIPCGQYVVLDLPNISVGLLRIQGLLQFLDDPRVPLIYVKANFVLVEGQLFIGSSTQQYSQRAIIELTPNLQYNRNNLTYTGPAAPADPANPRTLGHKAFAIVGGQVRLHGLPGPADMPVWVRLGKASFGGDTTIQVAGDVSNSWPVGGQIVITSSDYDRKQTETFRILSVASIGGGQSVITLDGALVYDHYGTYNGLSDGFGGFVDERAEVMLISRNIQITGTDEPSPYDLEGGHFMVFMTPYPPQYIEGVEFYKMGQQGNLGRYALHFRTLGVAPLTVCRKNSIHQSKQRCIVNHASHNITFDSNVAFNTSGHCFVSEEGGEQNNTWISNIGVQTNPVTKLISTSETDNNPATFWITNLVNTYIGNVGAGAGNAAFWFELRQNVRGDSLSIPALQNISPIQTSMMLFYNNTAHSNDNAGLRTYPNGMRPRISWNQYGATNVLDGIKSYKNAWIGMFVAQSDSLVITNSVFADNGWGLQFNQVARSNVTNSTFVGLTDNYGNSERCWDPNWTSCQSSDPHVCTMPLKWGSPSRSTGWRPRNVPRFGFVLDQVDPSTFSPNSLDSIKFANYDNYCNMASGLTMIGSRGFWNPGFNVKGLQFSSNTLPAWVEPRFAQLNAWTGLSDNGEQQMFSTAYDIDGSFSGGSPGYLVANTTQILPPGSAGCKALPTMNAYTCANVCYRSVWIYYPEPGFGLNPSNVNNTHGSFSYLKVTRVSDGMQLIVDGNLQETYPKANQRNFVVTLVANQVYQVEIVPSSSNPSFLPVNATIQLADAGLCGQGLTLRFVQVANQPWLITPNSVVNSKQCPGVQAFPQSVPAALYAPVCINMQPWLEIAISAGINNVAVTPYMTLPSIFLYRGKTTDGGVCPSSSNCSAIWSASTWLYDDSGLDRRPAFYNPVLSQPGNWKSGPAPLGNVPSWSYVATQMKPPNRTSLLTYYYRNTFNLSYSQCYSAILVDIIVEDAIILYINNVEALRVNLAPGYVDNKTNALVGSVYWFNWQNFTIPLNASNPYFLIDGVNTVAVEQHMSYWPGSPVFDMRVTPVYTIGCTTKQATIPEICDGVDNNLDGLIDNAPKGGLLTAPCSTACGAGVFTCLNGFYQNCTSIVPTAEICDGKDNDCDGLIDNGNNQLDCAFGNVCWNGACIPAQNATAPVKIWPRYSTGWSYKNTSAVSGNIQVWSTGQAPFGFDVRSPAPTWQNINTKISIGSYGSSLLTAYFSRSFNLTAAQIQSTFNIDFSVRRVDGIVVYLNGIELWRDNVNWGALSSTNSSTAQADGQVAESTYWNCRNCRRNNSALLTVGTNTLSAELHSYGWWRATAAFDMDLYQNVYVSCPTGITKCFRQVPSVFFLAGSSWNYHDGSMPALLTNDWRTPTFNDSSWLSAGTAPYGYNMGGLKTVINNGSVNGSEYARTLYFRKLVNISDAACFANLTVNLWAKDGVIFYINGVEAFRNNLPPNSWVNSTTYATDSAWNWLPTLNLTGGWLVTGMNLFAAEVHRSSWSSNQAFDMSASGWRDAVSCTPDATNSLIPWLNG